MNKLELNRTQMLALKGKKMKKVENILNWNGIEKKSKIYLGIGGIYKKRKYFGLQMWIRHRYM